MRQDVTVLHEATDEAFDTRAHDHIARDPVLGRRNRHGIQPGPRFEQRIAALDHLERVNVDVKRVDGITVVFQAPLFDCAQGDRLIDPFRVETMIVDLETHGAIRQTYHTSEMCS